MTDENIPSPGELLDAALAYAAAGLKIYPVDIRGLRPDGKKDVHVPVAWGTAATDDVEQVYEWWGDRYAGYGIGVDTGRSGLAVADADVKDGVDGPARLAGEIGEWDRDTVSRTPSGGLHVWYRDPDGQVGSSSNIFGTPAEPSGVDARGVGGTIFLPPTYVPGYGQYAWNPAVGAPRWEELPEAPAALARACPPGGRKKATPDWAAPDSPFMTASQGVAATIVHRDRPKTLEQAQAELMPLWEQIRDTKSPNGLWQAVASFARAAAHYQCFWDRAGVGELVLEAYRAGGHGYTGLDDGDVRAIESAFQLQEAARATGDLGEGWEAVERRELADEVAAVAQAAPGSEQSDAVEAMLAELLTAEQMIGRPRPRPLIKGVLNMDSESWLIGAAGSKKSFVALDMAAHVARGMPWQGMKVTQGKVLIIAAEGAAGLSTRVQAWEKHYGPMGPDVLVLPRPVQARDAGQWAVLVEVARRLQPVFVIGDTQARLTVGLEENSAMDMGIYVDAVGAIRRATGACVLSVHHTGRNGGDARGSSALDGAQDTELKIVASATDRLAGQLKVEKQKDLEMLPDIELRFERMVLGLDEDGQEVTSLVLLDQDAWRDAQSGGQVDVPEDWETGYGPMQVQIIKVLRDQGRSVGLTKAECFTDVLGRFYADLPDARRKKGSTFRTAWSAVLELEATSGDRVAVNAGGQKWVVDELALDGLPAGQWTGSRVDG